MQESLARLPAMTVACTLAEVNFFLSIISLLYINDFLVISTYGQFLEYRSNGDIQSTH